MKRSSFLQKFFQRQGELFPAREIEQPKRNLWERPVAASRRSAAPVGLVEHH